MDETTCGTRKKRRRGNDGQGYNIERPSGESNGALRHGSTLIGSANGRKQLSAVAYFPRNRVCVVAQRQVWITAHVVSNHIHASSRLDAAPRTKHPSTHPLAICNHSSRMISCTDPQGSFMVTCSPLATGLHRLLAYLVVSPYARFMGPYCQRQTPQVYHPRTRITVSAGLADME